MHLTFFLITTTGFSSTLLDRLQKLEVASGSDGRLGPRNAKSTAVQIDAAEVRRMDMRSNKQRCSRARDGAEQLRLPRDAG